MDIGTEDDPYIIEPIENPVPDRTPAEPVENPVEADPVEIESVPAATGSRRGSTRLSKFPAADNAFARLLADLDDVLPKRGASRLWRMVSGCGPRVAPCPAKPHGSDASGAATRRLIGLWPGPTGHRVGARSQCPRDASTPGGRHQEDKS